MKTHQRRSRRFVLCLLGAANGRSTPSGVIDAVERMRAIVDASTSSTGGFNKVVVDDDLSQDALDGWSRCGFNAGGARNGVMFAARAWGCGPVGCFERTEGWMGSSGDESDALRDVLVDAAFEAERGGDASDASGTASAAANGAIGLLESCGVDETTVGLVDVVWFETPGCGSSRLDDEEEADAYSTDANAWTDEMVAAYGTFRRAVELFGDAVRLRVVSCDVTGKCSRAAVAVAQACGASVSSLDEDETVDLGVRFRGSLGFASADGTERVEICRLSASRFDAKEDDAEGTLASSSSNTKTKRGDDAWRPMARALRVVEIARVGEVPGLYLSSDVDLRVRVEAHRDGTLKDEFFSAWRLACARASSWADVPALVVKSQTRLETNETAGGARRYRDLTRDEGVSTPMLMYPVVRKSETTDGMTTTTYLEFRLRPFVSTATLIGRLSKSAGAGGLTRVNVAMDHMSDLARYQALEEAEMALLRLSERRNVTLRDVEELDNDENAYAETITAPTSPTRPNALADFSPEIGGIKSASSSLKLLSAVNAAARGASVTTEDDSPSAPRIAYAKMWRQSVEAEAEAEAAFVRAETTTPSTTQSSVKFDEIFDRLTERNDVGRKRTLARDTTEGYYTKAFNEAVDISLAQLAQIGASTTLLKKYDDDVNVTEGERATATAQEERSFQAIVCCETDAAKEKRRAERRRMHEEKREKMFLALGVDPRAVKRRSSLDGGSTDSAAAAAAETPLPVVTASPQPPVIVSSSSKKPLADANDAFACPKCHGALNRPADGSRLNFCYMCGFKL